MPGPVKERDKRRISVNSISMITECNVQHRSDLLMDEHLRNVRQVQYELQSTLQELEFAKSEDEIETLKAEATDLKAQGQKLVLALRVMEKINTELAYARADLNDALHKNLGDINAARKRVIWLEDKMGELCGKKRLKTRRPSNRFVTDPTYGWDTDSEGEQTRRYRPLDSAERMYTSEQARQQTLTQLLGSEIGFTSDSDHMIGRQVGFQDISSHSLDFNEVNTSQSRQKGLMSQEEASLSGSEVPTPLKMQDHRKSIHDSMNSLTSGGRDDIAEESASEKFSTVKEVSVVGVSPYRSESSEPVHEERSIHKEDIYMDGPGTAYYTESPTDQEDRQELQSPSVLSESRKGSFDDEGRGDEAQEDVELQRDEEEEEEEEDGDRKGKKSVKEDVYEGEEEEKREMKTFIIELDGQATGSDQAKDKDQTARPESVFYHDAGAEYWQSEHHRFEFSEFADILTEINPLSYHKMGLAVPGSFIKREDTAEFEDLPWRQRRKGSDIKDIHRVALDKLAQRVHGFYDKVYNAAMISVRSDQAGDQSREPGVFQSLESGRPKPGSPSSWSSGPVPRTAPASIRQKTDGMISLPTGKEMKRGGTFVTKHLVFHPKPIPPPQVLPITRTSLNKEYPQFASSFAEPDPEIRKPAERLVDQRNLLEETKLVLYREKIKPTTPGPTCMERRFRKMIERDGALSNKSSGEGKMSINKAKMRKKMKTTFKAAGVIAKLQGGMSNWNQIKPQSRGKEYAGLRWERVKTIVHLNLQADRFEERIDGVRQLGLLRCGDTMVFYALKERLRSDPVDRVRYEAAKSLILIGCWEEEVIQCILKYLVMGNTEVRADLIETLIQGKNVQYVDKTIPSFVELVKVLSHFCRNPDPTDLIAFNSAVCLGRLCVKDDSAQIRLVRALEESTNTHIKAKALEILVKQLHNINDDTVGQVQQLLRESPCWKYRALACRLLISLGPKHACVIKFQEEIYSLLEQRLWDDPSMDVRLAAAKALTALGMFTRACHTVESKLEGVEEDGRAQAAVAVGTLGMKNEKLIRLLLEMLELDSSDYVRLMIIRTFGVLKLTDRRVLRCLKEREKLDGALAREAKKSLKIIEQVLASQNNKSAVNLSGPKYLHSRRVLSPILAGAV